MYQPDLRWRVIYLKFRYMLDIRSISLILNISAMTVKRILVRFITSGTVEKNGKVGRPGESALHPHEQIVILDCLLDSPAITQNEIAENIQQSTGSIYHQSTISRGIRRFDFTRKRVNCIVIYYIVAFECTCYGFTCIQLVSKITLYRLFTGETYCTAKK